ncbi:MAG: DUF2878 domain-containing protein [Woeseia sp.]|nr:DUF2878 domain-containing protein [Woeseia sp.]MBT8095677.1 DUF2878 domain-containing protein [Woeseia sp.]
MKGRPSLAAGFGLIGGPMTYVAGQKFGGIILVNPPVALIALGIGWAVMLPLLLVIAERFNGAGSVSHNATLVAE